MSAILISYSYSSSPKRSSDQVAKMPRRTRALNPKKRTAPPRDARGGRRGGLLQVGLGGGEKFLEGGSVTTRGGEGSGPYELRCFRWPGGLMNLIALLLREPEGENHHRDLRGLLLLRLRLLRSL